MFLDESKIGFLLMEAEMMFGYLKISLNSWRLFPLKKLCLLQICSQMLIFAQLSMKNEFYVNFSYFIIIFFCIFWV